MYLRAFEITFIIFALISIINLILLNAGISDRMKPMKSSDYVSFVAVVLLLYIVNAIILFFLLTGVSRFYTLLFAAVPFLIGKLTEYRTLKRNAVIQIVIIFCSIIYMSGLL